MRAILSVAIAILISGCIASTDLQRTAFESLGYELSEAPKTMNYVWLGRDAYPATVTAQEFMDSLRLREPSLYQKLTQYRVQYNGFGSYYRIIVKDRSTHEMIMYDYSCTDSLDGPIYRADERIRYDYTVVPAECKP